MYYYIHTVTYPVTHADRVSYQLQEFKTVVKKTNLLIILSDNYILFHKCPIVEVFAIAKPNTDTQHRAMTQE